MQLRLPSDSGFRNLLLDRSFSKILQRAFEVVRFQRETVLRVDRLQQVILLLAVGFHSVVELRFFFFDFDIGPDFFPYGPIVLTFIIVRADFRRIFIRIGCFRVIIVSAGLIRSRSGRVGRQCAHFSLPPQWNVLCDLVRDSLLLYGKERE